MQNWSETKPKFWPLPSILGPLHVHIRTREKLVSNYAVALELPTSTGMQQLQTHLLPITTRRILTYSHPVLESHSRDVPIAGPSIPSSQVIASGKFKRWIKGHTLGVGSTGKVRLTIDMCTGHLVAVKQVGLEYNLELHGGYASARQVEERRSRKRMSLATAEALHREITERLLDCVHRNIIRYLHVYCDEDLDGFKFLNIFMEYIPGCSVSTLLSDNGAFEEPLAKDYTLQILQGLEYLHGKNIIHGDIKGSNILVDDSGGVKISGFGILDFKKVDDSSYSVFWMAPEVVEKSAIITHKADIWSIGWLVIEMLSGKRITDLIPTCPTLQTAPTTTPDEDIEVSADAQEFLELTIQIEPDGRPEAEELQHQSWLVDDSEVKVDM